MAFSTTPYCDLAQVKSALDLKKTSDDGWLQELIGEAQNTLDRKIGYSFQVDGSLSAPSLRVYDGSGTESLFIDQCQQIVQVIETTYNIVLGAFGVYASGSSQTVDITADCFLAPNNNAARGLPYYQLKRITGNLFIVGQQNYAVKGIWGWSAVPAEITRACIRLITHWYQMRNTNYADAVSEQGAVRQKYNKQIPPDVQEIIDDYKHRKFICL